MRHSGPRTAGGRGDGGPGLACSFVQRRCEAGQGDGCDFCVRQFCLPCPSITDSTPRLAPGVTGSGARLVPAPSCLRRTLRWQEAPGCVSAQDDTATHGRDGPLRTPEGGKAGCLPSRGSQSESEPRLRPRGMTARPELGQGPATEGGSAAGSTQSVAPGVGATARPGVAPRKAPGDLS